MLTRNRTLLLIAMLAALGGCGGGSSSPSTQAPTSTQEPESSQDTTQTPTPTPSTFTIGGSVSGLSGTVVLQNSGGDDKSISTNGAFTFPTSLNSGDSYSITVFSQPASQICTVSSGSGMVTDADVTTISVSCADVQVGIPVCSWDSSTWGDCSWGS